MPSLRMKSKSTPGCLIEKDGLSVCQKSTKISKNSFSNARAFIQEKELEICITNEQDGTSFCNGVIRHEKRDDEATCDESPYEENLLFQKYTLPLPHAATVCMDSIQTTFSPDVKTIFSPILDSINNHYDSKDDCHGGGEKDCNILLLGSSDSNESSRNSYPLQSSNMSDFFISDMIVSSLPIEENSYGAFTEAASFSEYKCDEPSKFFDDEYVVLPFLEDSVEISNGCDERLCLEPVINMQEESYRVSIHQLRSFNQDSDLSTYPDWDLDECLDPHICIRNLPHLSDVPANVRSSILAQEARESKSVTLVLDLDETLVHSTLEHCDNADFTFPVFVNLKEHTVYVKQRPYLMAFLERVADLFQIVVFTASQSIYAKQLLDILDPEGKLISRRAYRESCIISDGSYTKDLTVLGVDLAKVVIIDNTPQVFRLQVNNGIPIKSWFNDPSDCALISLLPFLETLADAEDVRPIIAKRFGNKE